MLLNKLKKVSSDYVGAIDDCVPFLCRFSGDGTLLDALKGTSERYTWDSISIKDGEVANPAIIMYVKHILVDDNPRSPWGPNIRRLAQNSDGHRLMLPAAIFGIQVDEILFLKNKYRTKDNSRFYFETHDEFKLERLNSSIKGCLVRGSFDLRTCSYYNC